PASPACRGAARAPPPRARRRILSPGATAVACCWRPAGSSRAWTERGMNWRDRLPAPPALQQPPSEPAEVAGQHGARGDQPPRAGLALVALGQEAADLRVVGRRLPRRGRLPDADGQVP